MGEIHAPTVKEVQAESAVAVKGAEHEPSELAPMAQAGFNGFNGLATGPAKSADDRALMDSAKRQKPSPPRSLTGIPQEAEDSQPAANMMSTYSTASASATALVPFPDLEVDPTLSVADGEGWNDSLDASQPDGTQSIMASEEHQIQAFAKLEFDDGEFYMNTYAVELGRDIRAARLASQLDLHLGEGALRKRSGSSGGESAKSGRLRRSRGRHAGGSVVSESGGVIGVDHPASDTEKKSSRTKTKSISSSSQQLSRKSSFHVQKTDYNALALESLPEYAIGTNKADGVSQLPSPDLTPLIPIHPPAAFDGVSTGHKSISRKHIRISFNFDKHLFEVEIIGRNGAFVDEEWYASGEVQPLVSGSIIQIGGVGIRFVLPDVPAGETGAETVDGSDPLSGGKMSFDMADSDEEDGEEDEPEPANGIIRPDPDELPTRGRGKAKAPVEPEPPKPKRKGPGRPPKNGIISKREQALLARQARQEAKAAAEGKTAPPLGRGKGNTAKALELEAQSLQPNGKRKYTKRKRAGGEPEQNVRDSTEQTDSVPPDPNGTSKPMKEKSKAIKPPRSPSPVFDESKLTAEELAKPQQSYVVLIHEALSNSKTGQMSLPQIYRAIERRYPFFKLRVQTQGWQSSVRHNLSQHAAFRKIERDGKGWMWGLVPEVSIEKEKKRRPTPPPPQPQSHHYQHPTTYPPHSYAYPAMPHVPNGPIAPFSYGMPPRPPFPVPLGPTAYALSFAKPPSESTYKSPYESSAPAAPAEAKPINTGDSSINRHESSAVNQPAVTADRSHNDSATTAGLAPSVVQVHESSSNRSNDKQRYSKDALAAVEKFKSTLIASMPDKEHAEQLVSSAIAKYMSSGSSSLSTESDLAGADEKAIGAALANILSAVEDRNKIDPGSVPSHNKRVTSEEPISKQPGDSADTVAEMAADVAKQIPLLNGSFATTEKTILREQSPVATAETATATASATATAITKETAARIEETEHKEAPPTITTIIEDSSPPAAETGMELRGRRRKRAGSDDEIGTRERLGRGVKKTAL